MSCNLIYGLAADVVQWDFYHVDITGKCRICQCQVNDLPGKGYGSAPGHSLLCPVVRLRVALGMKASSDYAGEWLYHSGAACRAVEDDRESLQKLIQQPVTIGDSTRNACRDARRVVDTMQI